MPAELIEARPVDRARNAIKGLLDMTPEKTEVRQADGSWVECLVKTVSIGTTIRVKPGACPARWRDSHWNNVCGSIPCNWREYPR